MVLVVMTTTAVVSVVMVVMGDMAAMMTMGSDISEVGVLVDMGITIMIILAQGDIFSFSSHLDKL